MVNWTASVALLLILPSIIQCSVSDKNIAGEEYTPEIEISELKADGELVEASKCSDSDFDIWRGNLGFSLDLNRIANAGLGIPYVVRPKFKAAYPSLSDSCVECFVDNVYCGATQCLHVCAGSSLSARCLACVTAKCIPAFRICLGATNDEDMPPVPTEADVVTTTKPPQAPRTRRVKSQLASSSNAVGKMVHDVFDEHQPIGTTPKCVDEEIDNVKAKSKTSSESSEVGLAHGKTSSESSEVVSP